MVYYINIVILLLIGFSIILAFVPDLGIIHMGKQSEMAETYKEENV